MAWRLATSTRCWRTSEGVDRAFRKLDQLKPYIVWWQDDAEAARILASGDVLMTSASAPAITVVEPDRHRNFGLQWAASLYEVQSWVDAEGQSRTCGRRRSSCISPARRRSRRGWCG